MTKTELLELIRNGESSGIEFKRDDVTAADLAKEFVAFSNLEGGRVILGVDDDGSIVGTTRDDLETFVMNAARQNIEPGVIPYFEVHRGIDPGRDVAVATVPKGVSKPYARTGGERRVYYIRVGSTSREATRDELLRMFQSSGHMRFGQKPVVGSTLANLDFRRLEYYLRDLVGDPPPERDDTAEWARRLELLEFAVIVDGTSAPTVDGMLLFGSTPGRFVPQSGVRAIAYEGPAESYATTEDVKISGPMTRLADTAGDTIDAGIVEQALAFVGRNERVEATLVDGRREDKRAYPTDAVREVLVNALVHRDYSVEGSDVTLALFSDRLEVTSPGALPNTVTVESMLQGFRYSRNQVLVNVMRDYAYVDNRGMGIRAKVVPAMRAHNGTEPVLLAQPQFVRISLLSPAIATPPRS